jgi:hypothetical protein
MRTEAGVGMVVLEANSAPGFAYCTPGRDAWEWAYLKTAQLAWTLAAKDERRHLGLLTESKLPCETVGFAAALSHVVDRQVPIVGPLDLARAWRDDDGDLRVNGRKLKGGIRYLHHEPWLLLPPRATGTYLNPTDVDLGGARDKTEAAAAFEQWNRSRPRGTPLLRVPETAVVRPCEDLPDWNGWVVLKTPHLNSGDGIRFCNASVKKIPPVREKSVLQRAVLPGAGPGGRRILLGGRVHDIRMVVASGPAGFFPIMLYARCSRRCWQAGLTRAEMREALLTNIATRDEAGDYRFDYERLVMPSDKGWRRLSLRPVDFAVAFVQSVIATVAIDARTLTMASPCAATAVS